MVHETDETAGRALWIVALAAAAAGCSGDNGPVKEPEKSELINEVHADPDATAGRRRAERGHRRSGWVGSVALAVAVRNAGAHRRTAPTARRITLTNSTTSPAVDVTPLINSRKLQHRFFYTVLPENGVQATDLTIDGNSADYGEAFAIHVPTAIESRSWTLEVLLSHYEGDTKGDGLAAGVTDRRGRDLRAHDLTLTAARPPAPWYCRARSRANSACRPATLSRFTMFCWLGNISNSRSLRTPSFFGGLRDRILHDEPDHRLALLVGLDTRGLDGALEPDTVGLDPHPLREVAGEERVGVRCWCRGRASAACRTWSGRPAGRP